MDTTPKHILVEFGRRTYAFGLQWFYAETDEPVRKQAMALIRRNSTMAFNLIGLRQGDFPQYTIVSSEEGLKSGAIAAASVVAEMMPNESWLYVAEIPGQGDKSYWITYGREGRIMPEGDQVYATEALAREAFLALDPGRWKSISLPRRWKDEQTEGGNGLFSSAETSDIKDIFQKPTKAMVRLESISSTGAILKTGALALLLAGVAFLAWQFLAPTDTGPTPEEQAQQAQQLADLARQEQERIYAELDADKPWEQAPPAPAIVDGCLEAIRNMPINPAGYVYESGECTAGTITASYLRGASYPMWLREWGEASADFQVDIDLETSNAFITTTWEQPATRGPETLTDYVSMLRFLNESALLIAGQMTYTQPVEYRYEEYPDYVPLYGTSDLSITTTEPEQWRLALERLPGIVINTIRRQADSSSYTMEGQIYVSNR